MFRNTLTEHIIAIWINIEPFAVADPGERPVPPPSFPPLFLDQNEAQRAKKIFFETRPPPLISECG